MLSELAPPVEEADVALEEPDEEPEADEEPVALELALPVEVEVPVEVMVVMDPLEDMVEVIVEATTEGRLARLVGFEGKLRTY